jgi:hypothetical protein
VIGDSGEMVQTESKPLELRLDEQELRLQKQEEEAREQLAEVCMQHKFERIESVAVADTFCLPACAHDM